MWKGLTYGFKLLDKLASLYLLGFERVYDLIYCFSGLTKSGNL